ncbi:hypothetical protein Poli38472_000302 [Pythium oligandrum]|uniref:Nitronate monooxygenase n=1 Tax=Pythium oligandrum TaxID=41045 RepID=A0A8K1CCF9_PYTOL|nr:hypothetical protein Poli38472_000302 [Pythium oligandrum]|eukprot:TMW60260.1 hypothetical protein Poli38472_000302 [Pythium oligandrum]
MKWLHRPSVAALAHKLRVTYPIIQAPMVGVSTPRLAAAVSNAGGLGSVGLGTSDVASAREQIRATRALTPQPFNANFFCHAPTTRDTAKEQAWLKHMAPLFAEYGVDAPERLSCGYASFVEMSDAMTEMLLEEKPPVVSFHFGLPPKECVAALKEAGIVTLACVTSPCEARLAQEVGVDALVAQGYEAGGHRGVFDPSHDLQLGTLGLVQLLAKESTLPIIAAGGIMSGKSIAAAIYLGASGVQLGTAFILCPESSADQAYREALQSDQAFHTWVSPAVSGRPARGMANRVFTDIGVSESILRDMPSYPLPYDATKALDRAARAAGSTHFAVQWAGQAAPLARPMPASELVQTLAEETEQVTQLQSKH